VLCYGQNCGEGQYPISFVQKRSAWKPCFVGYHYFRAVVFDFLHWCAQFFWRCLSSSFQSPKTTYYNSQDCRLLLHHSKSFSHQESVVIPTLKINNSDPSAHQAQHCTDWVIGFIRRTRPNLKLTTTYSFWLDKWTDLLWQCGSFMFSFYRLPEHTEDNLSHASSTFLPLSISYIFTEF
jgi:hypothetical protein